MAYANGRLPATALTLVQTGIELSTPTAVAYCALKAAAKKELGRTISIAQPCGGYRPFSVQAAMQIASLHGTKAEKERWGLSTISTAALASPGWSNHGLGVCVDIVGTPMDAAFLALAKRFGFTRPLAGDPNHFIHDGKTAIKTTVVKAAVAKVAPKTVTVTAKAGDNLSSIAASHKVTLPRIKALNPKILGPKYAVKVGAKIRVA